MNKQNKELTLAALDRIEGSIKTIRSLLTENQEKTEKPEKQAKPAKRKPKFPTAQSLPADQLGPTPEFQDNDDWPMAVPPSAIIPSNIDDPVKQQFRAIQIVDLIGIAHIANKNVLDCGCGEAYLTSEIAKEAKSVVGYDLTQEETWESLEKPNLTFICSREAIELRKPFDLIVLYDVIDHLEGENPDEFLAWVASLLAPDGKAFIRCHPWTSRHGGHLYEKSNRAFLHLALTLDEMVRSGLKPISNLKITRPLATYDNLLSKAGFNIDSRKSSSDPVEKFFSGDLLDRIIKITWQGNIDQHTALKIMGNSYIDYVVSKRNET